jgi:hypothetical protein
MNDAPDYLAVPENERLWLISPPGSPPENWVQIREDPPNVQVLAEDLMMALRELTSDSSSSGDARDGLEVVFRPAEESLPLVVVEDWDVCCTSHA